MVTLFGGGRRDSVYFLILYFIFLYFMGIPWGSGDSGGFRGVPGISWFYDTRFLLYVTDPILCSQTLHRKNHTSIFSIEEA